MPQLILPELGEGIDKATLACWHVKFGDMVRQGDDVVEVVTDKASFNVAAQVPGRVKMILAQEGQEVKIGQALAIIE